MKGRIETTLEKAKAIKPSADRLITKARIEGSLAKKLLEQDLIPVAVEKMMGEVAPRFAKRNGGYTRIIKLGRRFGDNASTALIEWVEGEEIKNKKTATTETRKKKETQKKRRSVSQKKLSASVVARKTSKKKTVKKGASR